MPFKAAATNEANSGSGALKYLIDPLGLVDCAVDLRIYLLEAGFYAILVEKFRIEMEFDLFYWSPELDP